MGFAFLFPGQGSQSVGMMSPYEAMPSTKRAFDLASQSLGLDLWNLVAQGPAEELNRTVNTQPAMLVAGYAVYQAWKAMGGVTPTYMAGHSLGEYTALLCADALEITDAVSLVRDRAQAMQDAVPEGTGAIAALIGVEMHDVVELCKEASRVGIVEPANLNAPGQIVIAGHKPAVEKAIELAKSRGAKRAVMLPMSVPSHCALMRAAADRLSERLNQIDFKAPAVPVISNADVAINSSSHDIKVALAKQLFSPVRWIETIQLLSHKGVTTFVECGPGQVLIGMVKRISPGARILALKDMAAIEQTVKELSA